MAECNEADLTALPSALVRLAAGALPAEVLAVWLGQWARQWCRRQPTPGGRCRRTPHAPMPQTGVPALSAASVVIAGHLARSVKTLSCGGLHWLLSSLTTTLGRMPEGDMSVGEQRRHVRHPRHP